MQMDTLTIDVKNQIYSYINEIEIKTIKNKNLFEQGTFYDVVELNYLSIAKWIQPNCNYLNYSSAIYNVIRYMAILKYFNGYRQLNHCIHILYVQRQQNMGIYIY